mmetsp:Transcript_12214/g.42894  ORF Transcript_12214/g.42894 Transcript_12214/m.42894 type:complete len:270 (-) Transcript_12214:58-867(-)
MWARLSLVLAPFTRRFHSVTSAVRSSSRLHRMNVMASLVVADAGAPVLASSSHAAKNDCGNRWLSAFLPDTSENFSATPKTCGRAAAPPAPPAATTPTPRAGGATRAPSIRPSRSPPLPPSPASPAPPVASLPFFARRSCSPPSRSRSVANAASSAGTEGTLPPPSNPPCSKSSAPVSLPGGAAAARFAAAAAPAPAPAAPPPAPPLDSPSPPAAPPTPRRAARRGSLLARPPPPATGAAAPSSPTLPDALSPSASTRGRLAAPGRAAS